MSLWKRLAAGLVTGAMLLTSAGAVSAEVAQKTVIAEVEGETGLYQVNFESNLLQNGYQYVLLVASYNDASTIPSNGTVEVNINESSLTFIDQAKAEGGKVSFSVRPKNYQNSLVLLGGEFTTGSSPIVIGYIDGKGELKEFTLIAADDDSTHPLNLSDFTFTVYDGTVVYNGVDEVADIKNASEVGSAKASADGKVNIQIPTGSVTIQITRPGYVPMTIINYDVSDPSKDISQYLSKLADCAGDTDGNNAIDPFDIAEIIRKLNTSASGDFDVLDVDRNGNIDSFDIGALLPNLNISGRTYRYQ